MFIHQRQILHFFKAFKLTEFVHFGVQYNYSTLYSRKYYSLYFEQ
jgi:hypothetical protein